MVLQSALKRLKSSLENSLSQTILLFLLLSTGLAGCAAAPSSESGRSGGGREGRGEGKPDQPAIVEILQATAGSLDDSNTYTGTTEPRQQVDVRSQLTAQLLNLSVEVGDSVTEGQVIGQLDPKVLQAALQEAKAELAVRQAELAQARSELSDAQTAIDQAEAQLQQAQLDAGRLRTLAQQGAISQQAADLAQTEMRVAEQVLRSARERFRTQEQAIAAAQQRVSAQQAVVAQEEAQLSFTTLVAPVSGVVLVRQAEIGDLMQVGQEIVTLGDLQDMQVAIEVTDQDRGQIALGQSVQVQLDALPGQSFDGTVARLSPVADAASRLIPVEIALNTTTPIDSGLLARVRFGGNGTSSVVVPETALKLGPNGVQRQGAAVFVVTESDGDNAPQIKAQPVELGIARNGQVEITSGLTTGTLYVAKSDQPLTDGQSVRRSLISEF